jgi:hypothetical protein
MFTNLIVNTINPLKYFSSSKNIQNTIFALSSGLNTAITVQIFFITR